MPAQAVKFALEIARLGDYCLCIFTRSYAGSSQ